MSNITIIGTIGRDAEIKQTRDGKNFLSFSVAQTIDYKTEETAWYDCTVWSEKMAQSLSDYVKKGWGVTVVGEMRGIYANQRSDGNISTNFKINAQKVVVHRSPKSASQQPSLQGQWGASNNNDPAPF